MIKDPQEYLQEWEKKNNPFYPSEMRWDRVKVNTFLKDCKEQCNIANVSGSALEVAKQIPQVPQTQMALNDQIKILRVAANKLGLYDAADFIRRD